MRYRKKYTKENAIQRIEILKMSLQNYIEEIQFGWTPLILSLCNKTEEEARNDAIKKISSISEEIEYVRSFI